MGGRSCDGISRAIHSLLNQESGRGWSEIRHRFTECLSQDIDSRKGLEGRKVQVFLRPSSPSHPLREENFDFSFVDERVAAQYQTEIRLTQLINVFTILSIALLGLGLFSLVSLIVRKRTKEIGIRKVLGASVNSIVILISREFFRLIAVALLIGVPLAHIATTKWLEGYAYRTNISWWFYGLSAFITILIVLLSIGIRSFPAAMANPVKALRSE